MSASLLASLAREGFEAVHALFDRRSGARAYLAIHDTSTGPAFGGVRRATYPNEEAALADCLRLAHNMTAKCAISDLPAGGAKVVLLDDPEVDTLEAYRYLGRAVESLGGRFYAGPDAGTGTAELEALCDSTRYATSPGPGGPGQLAEATASGVFAGIRAGLEHLDGELDWPARRVVVQGLGAVGSLLAERLIEVGARVVGTDLDSEVAERVGRRLELEVVEPGHELGLECDVFSPNGFGGGLHDLSLPRLRARMIAGGANNVLSQTIHSDSLHASGVLYVPDFVINSGALIRGVRFHLDDERVPVEDIEEGIYTRAQELLERAVKHEEPPLRVARQEARARLDVRRAEADRLDPRKPREARPSKGEVSVEEGTRGGSLVP